LSAGAAKAPPIQDALSCHSFAKKEVTIGANELALIEPTDRSNLANIVQWGYTNEIHQKIQTYIHHRLAPGGNPGGHNGRQR
jgi:hypothetical protein